MNKSDLWAMETELHTLISDFFNYLIAEMEYAEDFDAEIKNPETRGEWLKRKRISLDLSQKTMSEKLGISFSSLRRYESGEREINDRMYFRIVKAIDGIRNECQESN